jgi:hypothetical protein
VSQEAIPSFVAMNTTKGINILWIENTEYKYCHQHKFFRMSTKNTNVSHRKQIKIFKMKAMNPYPMAGLKRIQIICQQHDDYKSLDINDEHNENPQA